jgi:transcriptional regulator with XRE-family HTH domain
MARKFSELRAKMSTESQRRAKLRTQQMLRDMRLADLRRARELTQQQLAAELNVNQAWISKVERQTDMYISTLRAYVEATGGELEIIARFKDEAIRINHIAEFVIEHEQPASSAANVPPSPNAGVNQNVRVSVFESQQTGTTQQVELWSGVGSNTGRSRTPAANTTSPIRKAA